jgi:hypothetical protein
VLVASIDPTTSMWDTKCLLDDTAITHDCMELGHAKEICYLLKMPMIVVTNSFCDTNKCDEALVVYYFDPQTSYV